MLIASIEKQSFIDWDNRMVAVVFTQGCNFRCGYCHNPSLVLPHLFTPPVDPKLILQFLASRVRWLDGVVISGGEPTIQKNLKWFLREVKLLGFPVKLDTNGTHPRIIRELMAEKLIDYVALDIKHILDQATYELVTGKISHTLFHNIQKTIHLLTSLPMEFELRTTVQPDLHSKETIEKLTALFGSHNYKLQAYKDSEFTVKNFSAR